DHQSRQPVWIRLHPAHIHAFADELLADEAPHVLVAYPRQKTRLQPKPGRPAGNVGRRAADIFVERPHVFETAADLRAIEIDARASDGNDIKGLHPSSPFVVSEPGAAQEGAALRQIVENTAG